MRIRRLFASGMAISLVVLGCSASAEDAGEDAGVEAAASSQDSTLRVAFNADMQPPDPDVFYEVEGNLITQSLYEGLVSYAPDSADIEPLLAESWDVSEDGLTYTFTLRDGVTFHDGTTMDSEAWVASFERRVEVDGAPVYMVADVASTESADPLTFVVNLAQPSSAFLDYLAAPYGPRAISPTVLEQEAGDDAAQSFLATASAGTGPYVIADWRPGDRYELTAFDDYWGDAPGFENVSIEILPDVATQRLQLEAGDLDIVTHGLPVADVEQLSSNDDLQVLTFPVAQKTVLSVNPNRPLFSELTTRQALRGAFDRGAIVEDVFGDQATLSQQMYATQSLPEGLAEDVWSYDTSDIEAYAAGLTASNLDLAYSQDEGGSLPRMAELIAAELDDLGFETTVRGLPISQVFELPALSPEQQPDLFLWRFNPDAVHPDTWARIFYVTDGAVNFLNASVPEADAAMDEGLAATDEDVVNEAYGRAGDLMAQDGTFLTFADNLDVMVARNDLEGFTHWLAAPYTLRLADLRLADQ